MRSLANLFWLGVRSGVATWIARVGVLFSIAGIAMLFPNLTGPGGPFQDAVLVVFFPLVFPLHFAAMYVMRALVILNAGDVNAGKWAVFDTLSAAKAIPWSRRRWLYVCFAISFLLWGWGLTHRSVHHSNFTVFMLSVMLAFYVNAYQVIETYREFEERRKD